MSANTAIADVLLDLPMRDGNATSIFTPLPASATFRPSYEGWKLAPSCPRRRSPSLLDLPMRDGNSAVAGCDEAINLLLDLPMRDGNISMSAVGAFAA